MGILSKIFLNGLACGANVFAGHAKGCAQLEFDWPTRSIPSMAICSEFVDECTLVSPISVRCACLPLSLALYYKLHLNKLASHVTC